MRHAYNAAHFLNDDRGLMIGKPFDPERQCGILPQAAHRDGTDAQIALRQQAEQPNHDLNIARAVDNELPVGVA
ncbi:hypothetical protein [Sphingomonas sp. 4RDLI-65]|uniref:hypothetical protein n=1 Tax=Sphingomonas sp. 4RDLI-65 TaxID=3111641 RepID=UPI003C2F232D